MIDGVCPVAMCRQPATEELVLRDIVLMRVCGVHKDGIEANPDGWVLDLDGKYPVIRSRP